MIVDRISLNIAKKYLSQFESSEGKIVDILFSQKERNSDVTKSVPKFDDINVLNSFINKWAPPGNFIAPNCNSFSLFELKAFTVIKNGTSKNFILQDGKSFSTKSSNISKISVNQLNNGYIVDIKVAKQIFEQLKRNEYILEQAEYIDCDYITRYLKESINELGELYNKYK